MRNTRAISARAATQPHLRQGPRRGDHIARPVRDIALLAVFCIVRSRLCRAGRSGMACTAQSRRETVVPAGSTPSMRSSSSRRCSKLLWAPGLLGNLQHYPSTDASESQHKHPKRAACRPSTVVLHALHLFNPVSAGPSLQGLASSRCVTSTVG